MDVHGQVHVYTGNGKGKTTAAFGLAVRALCSGKKVFVGQFVKSIKYSETKIDEFFDNIVIEQFGTGCFIDSTPEKIDIEKAQVGLKRCASIMASGNFDVVVLDEITIAISFSLLSINDVVEAIGKRSSNCEVIITGRYAPQELIDMADLVTEMREIKHYLKKGVLSRVGIDC